MIDFDNPIQEPINNLTKHAKDVFVIKYLEPYKLNIMNTIDLKNPEHNPESGHLYINNEGTNDIFIISYVKGWVAISLTTGIRWTEPNENFDQAVDGLDFFACQANIKIT